MFFGILINSFLDLIGLAAVLPLLAAILKEGFINENKIVSFVYHQLGFTDHRWFIVFLCGAILLFIAAKNVFGLWVQKTQIKFSLDTSEKLSDQVLLSAYNKGYLFFSNQNSNELLNRVIGVPSRFAQMLIIQLFQFLNELVVLCLVIVSLFFYDFQILLLLAVVVLPVFYAFYQYSKIRVGKYQKRLNELGPKISKPIFEIVFGFVDVVITGVFSSFRAQYLSRVKERKQLNTAMLVIQQIPNRLVEVCVILAVIIMLLYGVFVLESPTEIVTLLSVFALAAYRAIPSINRLMLSLVNIKGQEYVFPILESFLPFVENNAVGEELSFQNKIDLKGLTFRFPGADRNVLSEFNLGVKKGEVIGLIGKSGSGKTTLMNILLGFLKPTSGALLVDGKELNEANVCSWQKKIGYVRQDVFIIDGTVAENIAFGVSENEIDHAKLKESIERAQLTEVVEQLGGVYSTIGERGAKISGGQRQRVGIARALYHEAEVLFFDEATSALDSETENEITEAIGSLHNENLTMVIIAHRESTLKFCDRVIKLS